jgi:hypothetical protein
MILNKTIQKPPVFCDSPSIKGREDRYMVIRVDSARVLESWRQSVFSFEWLCPDGGLRALDDLPMTEREKRLNVESLVIAGKILERPVLGIGIQEHIEIGAGRAVFLTLSALGYKIIECHIPQSNQKEFRSFIVE